MADGIRVNDAALEISPEGLQALVNRQGAEIKLTKLDLSVSPEALNTLLTRFASEGEVAPAAQVTTGRVYVTGVHDGQRMSLDLQLGGLRVEFTPEGIRLVSG
jgi:hypothetical protein